MRILRSRLLAAAQEEAEKEASDARRSQVRTVDRSERIRTYNFPENRISDHRTGFKAYNLDQVLDGDLDTMIQACVDADAAAKLAAAGESAG
jgi:peptide chain release factor 1